MEFQIKFRFLEDKVQLFMYKDHDFEGTKELILEKPLKDFDINKVIESLIFNVEEIKS